MDHEGGPKGDPEGGLDESQWVPREVPNGTSRVVPMGSEMGLEGGPEGCPEWDPEEVPKGILRVVPMVPQGIPKEVRRAVPKDPERGPGVTNKVLREVLRGPEEGSEGDLEKRRSTDFKQREGPQKAQITF